MDIIKILLLTLLVVCALYVPFSKRILPAVIVYMTYSLIMAVIWLLLESPDLGITEAAVGAGITSILFFVVLKKLKLMSGKDDDEEK